MKSSSSLFLVMALAVLPAGGTVVNIDFQGGGGVTALGAAGAVLPAAGGHWNGQGGSGETDLLDAAGGLTSVRVWTSGFTGSMDLGDALYRDYLVGEVQLRGLDADASYELVLYGAANLLTRFDLAGPWAMTPESANHDDVCAYWDTTLPGVEGCNYVRGLATADAGGVIAIEVGLGAIAGLQVDLAHHPEPSVPLMQVLAGVVLLSRRRRQGRAEAGDTKTITLSNGCR